MNFLQHLKRTEFHDSCRWIVKYDKEDLVREVKLVYRPSEYSEANSKRYGDKARELKNKKQLIKLLENDKEKRRSKTQ